MPCVFPVLSMKAMALVRNGDVEQGEAIADGLAYLAGVLVTFCGLAAAVILLRNAGEAVGWGFQLQSPFVVAILAYVLFAVGLNLSGVFHVGGGLMGLGSSLQSQGNSLSGSFMTGILAVVVAAPCTVPFMGAAVGYALTQSSALTFLIFIALGFGLALPWLVISFIPGLTAFIPRGGAWTERIKEFLAFPMYASVAWLVWVLSQQTDSTGLFRVMLGLVAVAFAAWVIGRGQASTSRSILAAGVAIVAIAGSLALIMAPALPPPRAAASAPSEAYKGPAYEPYTPARLATLLAEGKPVFVNLTAAWCITCLFNEQMALDTDQAKADFAASGTVYLKGDWTNRDPKITALLRAHGRDGVPLYLHYPAGKKDPVILPQVLTPAIVSSAIRLEDPSP
jgi:thiol:disulfide interchange protein DsbD